MSLTTKTPEHVVPAYNLPRGRAVGGKVAEAAQTTAQAEAPTCCAKLRNRWGGVRLITRNGNDLTSRFPLAVNAVTRLAAHSFLLDGEAIVTKDEARWIAAFI